MERRTVAIGEAIEFTGQPPDYTPLELCDPDPASLAYLEKVIGDGYYEDVWQWEAHPIDTDVRINGGPWGWALGSEGYGRPPSPSRWWLLPLYFFGSAGCTGS